MVPVISPGPVAGSTKLPAGFSHPHASEEARQIAENGMILRVQVGSGVHGTSVAGQDDRDEMGLCLEPPQFVTGLARVPNGTGGHALRLGLQGIELLSTGRITLPVPEPHRAYLRSIRCGERPLGEVLGAITDAEEQLARLRDSPAIPGQPDHRWVDDWLHRSYLNFWSRTQLQGSLQSGALGARLAWQSWRRLSRPPPGRCSQQSGSSWAVSLPARPRIVSGCETSNSPLTRNC
jgi:hypothetical protein